MEHMDYCHIETVSVSLYDELKSTSHDDSRLYIVSLGRMDELDPAIVQHEIARFKSRMLKSDIPLIKNPRDIMTAGCGVLFSLQFAHRCNYDMRKYQDAGILHFGFEPLIKSPSALKGNDWFDFMAFIMTENIVVDIRRRFPNQDRRVYEYLFEEYKKSAQSKMFKIAETTGVISHSRDHENTTIFFKKPQPS